MSTFGIIIMMISVVVGLSLVALLFGIALLYTIMNWTEK